MPATLVWGKGFQLEDVTDPSGGRHQEVKGIDGGTDFISWSSVEEVKSLAERHGVDRETWPVYPDCEVESDVPLEDAQKRSAALRIALEGMAPRVVEEDYWLSFIFRLLRDDNYFFIMV
ncbi:hypothetical protein BE17_19775 [Sorangium cellulosum]|uniref:Uncharacterized protein n=1 Tax=Sorangium cellulosum TaxID=56 RepID=A0A150S3L6_SORCE|nr:hypothetical protein BE17_19775 [Sorangium cellulosum]